MNAGLDSAIQLAPAKIASLVAGMARFARPLTEQTAADTPQRRAILQAVRQDPGIPVATLKELTGMGWGSLYHHLDRLREAGVIRTITVGRRHLVLPVASQLSTAEVTARSLLMGGTAKRVAQQVAKEPEVSVDRLCQALSLSPRTVYYHVKNLVEAGVLYSSSPTNYFGLRPTHLLLSILADIESPESLQ